MATRKKHQRLPNGYGSIRYLGKRRKNPYAVHPPADIDGNRPRAICYVDDWMKGFVILTAYKAGTYTPGMEATLEISKDGSLDSLAERILADYNRTKGIEPPGPERTFTDVYNAFYVNKFPDGHKFSRSTVHAIEFAYKNCSQLHDKSFRGLRSADLQAVLDDCPLKHASLELIKNLYVQMYRYADGQGWCDKRYDQFVIIKQAEDDEHGVPFTDAELKLLWANLKDPAAEFLLIMCYSGWRITELKTLEVNLADRYFLGGCKTQAGKNRIVPIHSAILPLVERRMKEYGCLMPMATQYYRDSMYKVLTALGIPGTPKHTPHDCRHTFSRLCEKYGVQENDRKRMMGHAFNDITNKVYGHRDLEDLRTEIEKIITPL